MKIEIITDRKPFVSGVARDFGDIVECNADEGGVLIANGFALEIKPVRKKKNDG
jgi:hypothetical protein